jgi:hypothetical protein
VAAAEMSQLEMNEDEPSKTMMFNLVSLYKIENLSYRKAFF